MLERPRWLAARSEALLRSAPENPPPPDDLSAGTCGRVGWDAGLDAGRLAGFAADCGLESALPADGLGSRPRSADFVGARFCADGVAFACGALALADAALDAAFEVAALDSGNFALART